MHNLVMASGAEEQAAEAAVTAINTNKIEDTMIVSIIHLKPVTLPLHKNHVDSPE